MTCSHTLEKGQSFCLICTLGEAVAEVEKAKTWELPECLGDYEITGELGRGGMGQVYRGRHQDLQRDVAIKVLKHGTFENAIRQALFRREIETIAAFDHPHIIKVYDLIFEDGLLAFSMPLCQTGSLQDVLDEGKIDRPRGIALLIEICRAVQHAHDRGILHLDLKPANFLISEEGSALLSDFGLSLKTTERGVAMGGTAKFAAPEQLDPDHCKLTVTADVFALGRILGVLLSSSPDGPHSDDLRAVELMATQSNPDDRYRSASAFQKDLEAWQKGHPVSANAKGHLPRLGYWVNRNKALSLALGILLLTATISGMVFLKNARELGRAKARTEQALDARTLDLIENQWLNGQSTQAALGMAAYLEAHPQDEAAAATLSSFEKHLLHFTRTDMRREPFLKKEESDRPTWLEAQKEHRRIRTFAHSPNAQLTAVGDTFGFITIHQRQTGRQIGSGFRHGHLVGALCFTADSRHLISGAEDYAVRIWNWETEMEVSEPVWLSAGVKGITITNGTGLQSGLSLKVATLDGFTTSLDLSALSSPQIFNPVSRISRRDVNTASEKVPAGLVAPPGNIHFIHYFPESDQILVASRRQLRSYHISDYSEQWRYRATSRISSISMTRETSTKIILAQIDGTVQILGTDGSQIKTLRQNSPLFAAVPSPDDREILTAGFDGQLGAWRISDGRRLSAPVPFPTPLRAAGWSDTSTFFGESKNGLRLEFKRDLGSAHDAIRRIKDLTQSQLTSHYLMRSSPTGD